jgi:hypothetical protein
MIFTKKTLALWAVVLGLALALLLPEGGADARAALPSLPGLDKDTITRVELTVGVRDRIAFEGQVDTGWKMVQPFDADADRILIRALLNQFQEERVMDTRVDSGDRETYGLDQSNRILVDLFTTGDVPALSVNIGADLPGGVSFVRLPDDEGIYRAKVGGRRRVDKPAKAWVDRMILEEEVEGISGIELTTATDQLQLVREPSGEVGMDGSVALGPWVLVGEPGFDLDQKTVDSTARSLSKFRAGEILSSQFEGGWAQPAATVVLRFVDGRSTTLTFGSRTLDGAAFVRKDDGRDVYRISETYMGGVTRNRASFASLQVLDFEQEEVSAMRLDDGGVPVRVMRLASGSWQVTEPANVYTDVKQVFFSVNTLGDLRAVERLGLTPEEAGLTPPSMTVTVDLEDGRQVLLELGDRIPRERARPLWYARIPGETGVFTLASPTVSRIRQGFGRAD